MRLWMIGILALLWPAQLWAQPLDLSGYELVDLTHSYDADTIYWPTSPTRFELDELSRGQTEGDCILDTTKQNDYIYLTRR